MGAVSIVTTWNYQLKPDLRYVLFIGFLGRRSHQSQVFGLEKVIHSICTSPVWPGIKAGSHVAVYRYKYDAQSMVLSS